MIRSSGYLLSKAQGQFGEISLKMILEHAGFIKDVGYVNILNLVGKAKLIFFSNDTKKSSLLKFWNLSNSFRLERSFKKL